MMLHAVIEVFLWLLGLCVGSFLNVVVYRLPLGLSIADPPRSFCPRCHGRIAWHDNLPVLSWVLLGGRCRACGAAISVQYPLVEALTGLAFVLVFHLLFVTQARVGVVAGLPADLPLLAAWLVLVAGLIACAAMDVVSYMVDVRVTFVLLAAGVMLHALWPRAGFMQEWAATPMAGALVAAFVASGVALWVTAWRGHEREDEDATADSGVEDEVPEGEAARLAGGLGVAVFILLAAAIVYAGVAAGPGKGALIELVAVGSLVAMFGATVVVGGQQRAADHEIRAAIEEEQPQARRMALRELMWLMPAVAAAAGGYGLLRGLPAVGAWWEGLVGWSVGPGFVPLAGGVFAIHGAMVGALAGWVLRIFFTLAFGREAFGVGDIYILAAAGAAAGWDIALLGLLLSIGVALVGWIFGLLLKSTVMIPFGPWLAIGFLLALLWNKPAREIALEYHSNLSFAWQQRPDLVMGGLGLMVVATAAAVILARVMRRWVVPDA